jgi:low temperature requirement protein LtrA
MRARAIDEVNRAATPLELLFDLTFVAAVAQLAARLAHDIAGGHAVGAVAPFLMVFFAIWWAWMNFTWFASAYDCDDLAYRLAAFVQMAGVLVLAAGTGRAFDHGDYTAVTGGYIIMRLGLLFLWLRAAVQHPLGRATSLRYVGGIMVLDVLWVGRLFLGDRGAVATFLVLAVLEMFVPWWAERRGPTSWHPHHIAERYALFTIILLGESVFASTNAVADVIDLIAGPQLMTVAGAGLTVVAALWWLYFSEPAGAGLARRRDWSYVWGYGHYLLFAALAALGAGLEVVVIASAGHAAHLHASGAVAAVAVPVAVALAMLELRKIPDTGERVRIGNTTVVALAALAGIVAAADQVGLTAALWLIAATATGLVVADVVGPTTSARRSAGRTSGRRRS